MATLAQQVALRGNKTFSGRLTAAGVIVALEVLGEPVSIRGNPLRRSLASGVLGNPDAYEVRFATAVLADPATYGSQVTSEAAANPAPKTDADADAALLARLRAVWSQLAGVEPPAEG